MLRARRTALPCSVAAIALALTGCFGGDSGYKGDPKCFSKGASDHTCKSSEGVLYRVVDRDRTATIGALSVRLASGPLPLAGSVVATVALRYPGRYDGDIALQQAKGALFVPRRVERSARGLTLTFVLPKDAAKKLYKYPSFLTFLAKPTACPGRRAQCFAYIRLWK